MCRSSQAVIAIETMYTSVAVVTILFLHSRSGARARVSNQRHPELPGNGRRRTGRLKESQRTNNRQEIVRLGSRKAAVGLKWRGHDNPAPPVPYYLPCRRYSYSPGESHLTPVAGDRGSQRRVGYGWLLGTVLVRSRWQWQPRFALVRSDSDCRRTVFRGY